MFDTTKTEALRSFNNMKRFPKATATLDGGGRAIKNDEPVNDHPQNVYCDSSEVQATRKAASSSATKQGRLYENIGLVQASTHTRSAHLAMDSKDGCTRDRAWIKHAYLQGTLTHAQQQNDTDTLDTTKEERSKLQVESKTDTALITKKLPLNKESSEAFAARHFVKEPPVVGSLANESNRTLKKLQKSEVEVIKPEPKLAESEETKVCFRSVKEIIKSMSHMEHCESGVQPHSSRMDSVARSIDDEKMYSISERSLTKIGKPLTKQDSLRERLRKSEKEEVTLKHHYSAYGRKDKIGKFVLLSRMDHTSNTNENVRRKLPVKLDEDANTKTEEASRNEATMMIRELASVTQNRLLQPTKLPDTVCKAKDSMEDGPMDDNSSSKIIWRGQVKSQSSKVESVQRKMHNRCAKKMAMVYLHQSSNEKPKWNQKVNREHGVSRISKGKMDDNAQDVCADQGIRLNEGSEPDLPERGYLEDIDFVVNEFDVILHTNPELPARAYLEDIDFVSKEFDLFFKKKPRHQNLEEQKGSTCGSGSEISKFVREANESPLLNSGENTEDQNDDYAALSQLNVSPCDHCLPLVSSQSSNPGGTYVNHHLLKGPHTSTSHWETNSSKGQYQPVIARTQDPKSKYDLVAVKSQKILKEDQGNDEIAASNAATELDASSYQPLLFVTRQEHPEENYCMVFTKPTLSAENGEYDNPLLIGGKSPRSLQFPSTCTSSESHGKVQPKSMEATRNLRGQAKHQVQATTSRKKTVQRSQQT